MLEEQIDRNTSDRQLLYDIRTESRKTNELLAQLLEVLRPVAKDAVQKTVKPKATKEEKSNESLPISKRSSDNSIGSSPGSRHPGKRKTMPDKQHRGAATILPSDNDSDSLKRVSSTGRSSASSKIRSKK